MLTALRCRSLEVSEETLLVPMALAILANCDLAPLHGCLTRIAVESLQLADSRIVCQAAQLARALFARPTPALFEPAEELYELLSDAAKLPPLVLEMHPIVLASLVEVAANVETGCEGRALELFSLLGHIQSDPHTLPEEVEHDVLVCEALLRGYVVVVELLERCSSRWCRSPSAHHFRRRHSSPSAQTFLVPATGRQIRIRGGHPRIGRRADRRDEEEWDDARS
jgi:hypothetical protein